MADDIKISALDLVDPVDGSEQIPCVQGGDNRIMTLNDVLAFIQAGTDLADILATGNDTGSAKIIFGYGSTNTVPYLNSSKELVSSSLTYSQLGMLFGITSDVQLQVDNIVALVNSLNTIVTDINNDWNKLATKKSCRLMALANVNLASAPGSYDGISANDGDRILLVYQTSDIENGIYEYSLSGGLTPTVDFSPPFKITGCLVEVEEGNTKADSLWRCTTDETWNPGMSVNFDEVDPLISGGAPTPGAASAPSNWYGNPSSNGLAQPDAWLELKRGATTLYIPAYT